MTTLICHPDNLEILRNQLAPGRPNTVIPEYPENLSGFMCIADSHMERTRKTGQYVLPDGRVVPKDQVGFGDRFVEYSPGDLELALFMGWVKEEETLVYYLVKPPEYRMYMRSDITFDAPFEALKWPSSTKMWGF